MKGVLRPRVAHAFRRTALPLASYYAVTLAVPLANGAAQSGAFVEHALAVLVVPPVAIILACTAHTMAHAFASVAASSLKLEERERGSSRLAGEQGVRVDETERVAKRVVRIEGALSPRPGRDLAHRQAAIAALGRQPAQALRPAIHLVEIVDGEVQMIEIRMGVAGVSIGPRAVEGKRDVAAREVVSPGRNARTRLFEERCVELHRRLEIGNRQDYAVQPHHGHTRTVMKSSVGQQAGLSKYRPGLEQLRQMPADVLVIRHP
jgi:hypothetical protein